MIHITQQKTQKSENTEATKALCRALKLLTELEI